MHSGILFIRSTVSIPHSYSKNEGSSLNPIEESDRFQSLIVILKTGGECVNKVGKVSFVSIPHSYSKNKYTNKLFKKEIKEFQSLIVILKTQLLQLLGQYLYPVSIPHSYSKNMIKK